MYSSGGGGSGRFGISDPGGTATSRTSSSGGGGGGSRHDQILVPDLILLDEALGRRPDRLARHNVDVVVAVVRVVVRAAPGRVEPEVVAREVPGHLRLLVGAPPPVLARPLRHHDDLALAQRQLVRVRRRKVLPRVAARVHGVLVVGRRPQPQRGRPLLRRPREGGHPQSRKTEYRGTAREQ